MDLWFQALCFYCVTVAAPPAPQAKSEFCKMANSQRNPVAWNAYYHCLSR